MSLGLFLGELDKTFNIYSEENILNEINNLKMEGVIFIAGAREQPKLRSLFNYGDPSG